MKEYYRYRANRRIINKDNTGNDTRIWIIEITEQEIEIANNNLL